MGKDVLDHLHTNLAEEAFFKELEHEYFGSDEIDELRKTLSMPLNELNRKLNTSLERLNELRVPRERASHRVKRAWEILDAFMSRRSSYLKTHDLTVVVFGSMVFDDPKNLDFDLLVVGENETAGIREETESWISEMNQQWEEIGSSGHISYLPMSRLDMHCRALNNGWEEYVGQADVVEDFLSASAVLSGEYLHSDAVNTQYFKERYKALAEETPILLAYTTWSLGGVIINRELRRAGVAPHQTGEK